MTDTAEAVPSASEAVSRAFATVEARYAAPAEAQSAPDVEQKPEAEHSEAEAAEFKFPELRVGDDQAAKREEAAAERKKEIGRLTKVAESDPRDGGWLLENAKRRDALRRAMDPIEIEEAGLNAVTSN